MPLILNFPAFVRVLADDILKSTGHDDLMKPDVNVSAVARFRALDTRVG
jgi:hypothetical protein